MQVHANAVQFYQLYDATTLAAIVVSDGPAGKVGPADGVRNKSSTSATQSQLFSIWISIVDIRSAAKTAVMPCRRFNHIELAYLASND